MIQGLVEGVSLSGSTLTVETQATRRVQSLAAGVKHQRSTLTYDVDGDNFKGGVDFSSANGDGITITGANDSPNDVDVEH